MSDTNSEIEAQALMRRCLELAGRGSGQVAPNPLVGALLVSKGRILAEGFHERFGGPHAEVNAIANISDPALLERCSLYVNLEPCSHFGKTAPCADLIIRSRIPRVIIGCADIFEAVRGRGIEKLKAAGIDVREGLLAAECMSLNRRFFTAHARKRPYVILKWAQTADGFLAREDYTSKWISSEASRRLVHEWRAVEDAVLIGSNTARHDNPALTVRMASGRNPLRLVIDRGLTLPPGLNLFDGTVRTLVFNGVKSERPNECLELVKIDADGDFTGGILSELHRRQISSVIVEGGARTLNAFIAADAWDEARVFTSPGKFGSGIRAPEFPHTPQREEVSGGDRLGFYLNHWLPKLIEDLITERGYSR